ncbi:MAG TPA: hypothetical protein HA302_04725 [Thermococcaceae archaeon]|nr:MAG: Uncharacterized protein XD61_1586 [Thermococcus sp. 40_45]HII67302.1 hypothetical protein [Thermococcaceae archaeon]
MNPHAEPKYEDPLLSIIDIWANKVIESEDQYSEITKLFAILYKQTKDTESYFTTRVPYPANERYDMKDILYSLVVKDYSQLQIHIPQIRNNYYKLLERSHFRRLDKLIELLKEGLFFEVIIRKRNIAPSLLNEDLVNRIIEALDTWNRKDYSTIIKLFKSTFSSQIAENHENLNLDEFDEIELALLSHLFFEKYVTSGDHVALYNHYKSIEALINMLKESSNIINAPSEKTLRMLFKIATILNLTGYSNSLSLPNEERLKYLNSMLVLPPLRSIFEEKVKDAIKMGFEIKKIPGVGWDLESPVKMKMPLYLGIVILMILSSIPIFVNENILSIKLSWKFYVFYYTIWVILMHKTFRLSEDIIKELWGDKHE